MSETSASDSQPHGRRTPLVSLTAWREDMSTGDGAIDGQHRDLLNMVDDLLVACRERRMAEEIGRLLWFLKRYVRKHFRDEEKLQIDSGYPGYAVHRDEHAAFFLQVRRLETRHAQEGASSAVIVESLHLMCEWLHEHFRGSDRTLVEYLQDIGHPGAP